MIQNLNPGAVKNVAAGEIPRTVHVYRSNNGYDSPGHVGWKPQNGPLQVQPLNVGQTVAFQVNGAAGTLANGCPSMVQLLWQNQAAVMATNTTENAAGEYFKGVRSFKEVVAGDLDPAQQAMQTLTAQWYNAVVGGCGLDATCFQLVQGATPIGSTSEQLWNVFDVVPPQSVTNFYNPSQLNVFSSDYGAVINNLVLPNTNDFQNAMGDYYTQWTAYLQTNPAIPSGGVAQLFQNWSQLHMPPNQAATCYADYLQATQSAVYTAVTMWAVANGTGKKKAYNVTIDQLTSALSSAKAQTFSMDSATESSDLSHTWAQGEAGGVFDFFEGGASGQYDSLTEKMTSAGIDINVSFQRLLTFPAAPLSQSSTDPILSAYAPWYDSAALNIAYQTQDNTVWKSGSHPNWNDTFGPSGNMLRTTSALVIVDGISITMTSNSGFSSSEQTQFKAAAQAGFFPFFEAEASGGWQHDTSFDANGNVTITSTSPLGNPTVLGAIVTPIGGVMML